MTLILLAINDAVCHGRPGDHLWIVLAGLLYPHLGHLLLGRFNISHRPGHALFMLDGLFVGTVVGALDFAMLPSLVLAAVSLFNWMLIGGPALIALGMTFMFLGMMTASAVSPLQLAETTTGCNASDGLASVILLGYFLIVARIIHQLVEDLRQQQVEFQARTDSANTAKQLAERALLAVLPASAARKFSENGQMAPEFIPGATLLLLELNPQDNQATAFENLKDTFHICDMILARHGIELIKTFGRGALGMSHSDTGPDDAVRALVEIGDFFTDHQPESGQISGTGTGPMRGLVHFGSITTGLTQPERLNIDVLGKGREELFALANLTASLHPATWIVSPTVYKKLRNPAHFQPVLDNSSVPFCYQYSPEQVS